MDFLEWWQEQLTPTRTEKPAILFYSFADAKWYDVKPDGPWVPYSFADAKWYDVKPDGPWVPIPAPSWDHRTWRAPDEQLITMAQAADLERWLAL